MHQHTKHTGKIRGGSSGAPDLRSNFIRPHTRTLEPGDLNARLQLAPWDAASPAIADLPDLGKTRVLALGMQEIVKASKLENPFGADFPLAEFTAVKLEDGAVQIVGQSMVQFIDPRRAAATLDSGKLSKGNVA